jgi:hypothetical protein
MYGRWLKAAGATLGILAAVGAFNGCGSAEPSTAAAGASDRVIRFESPAVRRNGIIAPTTRCGSGSLWLPLKWGPLPPGTKELAIYIGRYKYENSGGRLRLVVPFADLVYHIKPWRSGNAANTIPEDAAWSFFGPLSCPPVRKGQKILQEVFALNRTRYRRELTQEDATRLTEEALGTRSRGAAPPPPLGPDLIGIGRFTATYVVPTG